MVGVISICAVVVGPERRGRPKTVQQGNREWVSIIGSINAMGWAISPFIIFQGKQPSPLGTRSKWRTERPTDIQTHRPRCCSFTGVLVSGIARFACSCGAKRSVSTTRSSTDSFLPSPTPSAAVKRGGRLSPMSSAAASTKTSGTTSSSACPHDTASAPS